jgi:hypothetical protein
VVTQSAADAPRAGVGPALSGPITEQEVRAFAGRNASYYSRRWRAALNSHRVRYDQVAVACRFSLA